ncbi:MAG: UTP--glucose-1-phosphate uridylyltransferase [Planctomycetales bacterium]|nr:UTP--glucose-1-phosphate uridylyltransferase [Planctomycetales bacterium]
MSVKKAVIAVAGYGTRFLPATKAVPKEMLSVVNKPIVQHLVEEAVQSGIEDIILVTRSGSQAISDHFDSSRELEVHLEAQGKMDYCKIVQDIPKLASFAFVRQARHLPYGNGTPLLAARSFINPDEPIAFMFGDDLVLSETPCLKQLIDVYEKHQPAAVVAFQDVPREEVCHYGSPRMKPNTDPPEIEMIIEKPKPEEAPSTLAQLGRFILTPRVIDILETMGPRTGGELYLTDAIDILCKEHRVIAHTIEGHWHTTGDPLRYLITNVEYAVRDPDVGPGFVSYLKERFG